MPDNSSTILGFDFGKKHIGIAVGQTITYQASPLGSLGAKAGKPDWIAMDSLIKKWSPFYLVVGLPLNMDGTESAISRAARQFGRQLKKRYQLKVEFVDERLSTREAVSLLKERVNKTFIPSSDRNKMAAQVILQSWLNQIQTSLVYV